MVKTCTKCGKSDVPFGKDRYSRDGLAHRCKQCKAQQYQAYCVSYPERRSETYRKYRMSHVIEKKAYSLLTREQRRAYEKAYAEGHRDKLAEKSRRYRAGHKEKVAEYNKEYRRRNPSFVYSLKKAWNEKHREQVLTRRKLALAARFASNPEYEIKYRLRLSISNGINHSLGGKGKGSSWTKVLGYNVNDLKAHLESQFSDGMSWKNKGEWHIDHIRPINSFNFKSTDDPDFKKCWALENLRPLWGFDNLSKGAKWAVGG